MVRVWVVGKLCDPLIIHGPYLSALAVVLPIKRRYTNNQITLTLYSQHWHKIFGHWKAVTAIFLIITLTLTLTLIYRTVWEKRLLKTLKNNHSVGVKPATYAVQSEHAATEPWRQSTWW